MPARGFLAVIAAVAWANTAAGRDLQSADIYSADHPTVQATARFGQLVEERSGGRHRLVVLGEENKSSEAFIMGQLRNGILDMARLNLASLANMTPAAFVPAMPYVFRSTEHMRHVLDGPIGQELLATFDRFDVIGLCYYDMGARSFYGARPVRKAADIAGAKVRVPPLAPWVAMFQALGVEPVSMPFERVHPALRNGTVDFADDNWPAFIASRHYEVARYFSLTRHSMSPGVLLVSKRTWNTLSADDQAIFRAAAKESGRLQPQALGRHRARHAQGRGGDEGRDRARRRRGLVRRGHCVGPRPATDQPACRRARRAHRGSAVNLFTCSLR